MLVKRQIGQLHTALLLVFGGDLLWSADAFYPNRLRSLSLYDSSFYHLSWWTSLTRGASSQTKPLFDVLKADSTTVKLGCAHHCSHVTRPLTESLNCAAIFPNHPVQTLVCIMGRYMGTALDDLVVREYVVNRQQMFKHKLWQIWTVTLRFFWVENQHQLSSGQNRWS